MTQQIKVDLQLSGDTPSSMNFEDVDAGLADPWYRFEATPEGGVSVWANRDGCEWLARMFLKLARSEKAEGYHSHHTLEFGHGASTGEPELTIGITHVPDRRPSSAV